MMQPTRAVAILLPLAFLLAWPRGWGDSSPGFVAGQVPSAAQWNGYFAAKTDSSGGTLTGGTLSGGTIDGATIGGTTPGAGTFTTLAASTSMTTPKLIGATGGALTIAPDACGDTVQFKGSPSGSAVLMSLTGSCLGNGSVTIGALGGTSVALPNVSSLSVEQSTPVTSSSPCTAGQIQPDQNYIYECVSTNTWKRAALSSF